MSQHKVFQIESGTGNQSNTLLTTLLGDVNSLSQTQSPATEAVVAVEKICRKAGATPIVLVLDETYESLATLESFLAAKADFSVCKLKIKNGQHRPSFIKDICDENQKNYRELFFDFEDKAHVRALDFLSEKTRCNFLDVLIQMWATIQIKAYTVFPGRFIFPIGNYSAIDFFAFNFPDYFESKLFDFFTEYSGEASFLTSTRNLANSFLQTTLARESIFIGQHRKDAFDFNDKAKGILFSDAGFSLLPTDFMVAKMNVVKDLRGIDSIEVRKYEALKFYRMISDSPFRYHRQIVAMQLRPANSIRKVTETLLCDFSGSYIKTEVLQNLNTRKYDQTSLAVFPELVSSFRYEDELGGIIKYINKLEFYGTSGNAHTEGDLHLKSELAPIIKFIKECVNLHLDERGYQVLDFEITQCWATKTLKGQSHHPHAHPNCFLSGVFYLTEGGGSNLVFHSPTFSKLIEPENKNLTPYNQKTFEIKTKIGRLIIFSSELRHSTRQHLSDEPRLSLAFNVWPRGELGAFQGFAWTRT